MYLALPLTIYPAKNQVFTQNRSAIKTLWALHGHDRRASNLGQNPCHKPRDHQKLSAKTVKVFENIWILKARYF
jgi:hypothetical protein